MVQGLRSTAQKLTSYFTKTYPHMHCSWTVPEKPSLYGYFDGHPTVEAAYDAVKLSINVFQLMSPSLSDSVRPVIQTGL